MILVKNCAEISVRKLYGKCNFFFTDKEFINEADLSMHIGK